MLDGSQASERGRYQLRSPSSFIPPFEWKRSSEDHRRVLAMLRLLDQPG